MEHMKLILGGSCVSGYDTLLNESDPGENVTSMHLKSLTE